MRETGEENRTRESIGDKTPELNEEMWEGNRKIMDIVDEKTFQPGQGQGKKDRRWCGERRDKCRLPEAPCIRETDLRLPAGFWLH